MTEARAYSSSEVAALVRRNTYGWGIVATLVCVIPSAMVFNAIPKFRELFAGFGAELTPGTQFMLDWPWLLWVLPALSVLVFVISSMAPPHRAIATHRRTIGLYVVICAASLGAVALAVQAMYSPIFALGAVV